MGDICPGFLFLEGAHYDTFGIFIRFLLSHLHTGLIEIQVSALCACSFFVFQDSHLFPPDGYLCYLGGLYWSLPLEAQHTLNPTGFLPESPIRKRYLLIKVIRLKWLEINSPVYLKIIGNWSHADVVKGENLW